MAEQREAIVTGISGVSSSGLVEVVVGLIFVVLLIFALAWLYKRFGNAGMGMGNLIRVIAAMSLGSRDRIALIEVGQKQLLIAISPGRISTLHVFEDAISVHGHSASAEAEGVNGCKDIKHEFARKLQTLISGNKA